jgi:hypothetical protein
MTNALRCFRGAGWLVLFVCLAGCGAKVASVSGRVTYENQPIEKGTINFMPADGVGSIAGGEVSGGKYQVAKIPPGKKIVEITAVKDVPFARSSEEMAKMAATNAARGDSTGLIDPADVIPPNAEGNNSQVELKAGAQELNFDLKKPKG